jgi:hypothetical protein
MLVELLTRFHDTQDRVFRLTPFAAVGDRVVGGWLRAVSSLCSGWKYRRHAIEYHPKKDTGELDEDPAFVAGSMKGMTFGLAALIGFALMIGFSLAAGPVEGAAASFTAVSVVIVIAVVTLSTMVSAAQLDFNLVSGVS